MKSTKAEFYNNLNKFGVTKPNTLKVGDLCMLLSKTLINGSIDYIYDKSYNNRIVNIEFIPIYNAVVKYVITFISYNGTKFSLEFNRDGFSHKNQDKNGLLTTIIIKQNEKANKQD